MSKINKTKMLFQHIFLHIIPRRTKASTRPKPSRHSPINKSNISIPIQVEYSGPSRPL